MKKCYLNLTIFLAIAVSLISSSAWATTYYVSVTGGTCGGASPRCTGLATADDPGTGTNQACACKYGEYVLGYYADAGSQGGGQAAIMSGGDRLIYLNDVPTGYETDLSGCSQDFPYGCLTRPPPSGTALNPTEIYGANWLSCNAKSDYTKIWGRERAQWIFNLAGHDYISFNCLNITDKSSCVNSLNGQSGNSIVCNRSTYPMGNHADNGIYDAVGGASHILTNHVWIHGLVRGVFANKKDNWTLNDSESSFNTSTNWDNDIEGDGSHTSNADTGEMVFNRWVNSWGGCGEVWDSPGTPYYCASQAQNGYGDCQTTGGGNEANYTFNDVTMDHCVSDAIDNLYDDGTSTTMKVIRGKFQGNAGQAIKSAAKNTYVESTVAIGNCAFFKGKTYTAYDPAQPGRSGSGCNNNTICEATENSRDCRWNDDNDNGGIDAGEGDCAAFDNCRAGSVLAFANKVGNQKWFNKNSTFYSNGDTLMTIDPNVCPSTYDNQNSYFVSGIEFNDGSDKAAYVYSGGSGACADGTFKGTGRYNRLINTKHGSADIAAQTNSTWSASAAPFIGPVPLNTNYLTGLDVLTNFNLADPMNDADETVTCQGDCSVDVNNFSRGSSWDIGAYQFGSAPSDSTCGNGTVDAGEDCDGDDLNSETCISQGFSAGTLGCAPNCLFDTSACTNVACGDGDIDTGEQCDGAALNSETCTSRGFDGGTLACASNCTFNESACTTNCGNGTIQSPEECDGTNLNSKTCVTQGFDKGTLACSASCNFNTSGCSNNICGDGSVGDAESCDGSDLDGETCVSKGFDSGILGCHSNCTFDTSDCTVTNPAVCEDGDIDSGEQCDGAALNSQTCVSQGFVSGTLSCNSNCTFNTTLCSNAVCGNGIKDAGESCDGSQLNSQTCVSQGFDLGILTCNSNCTFNTTGCRTITCGDGIQDTGEACDGADLNGGTCQNQGFDTGTLACLACSFDTSGCSNNPVNTNAKMIIGGQINLGGLQGVQ